MAKISNSGRFDITIPSGHVVPANGELLTTNEVIRMIDNQRFLPAMKSSGEISYELDADDDVSVEKTPGFEVNAVATMQAEPVDAPREFVQMPDEVVSGVNDPGPFVAQDEDGFFSHRTEIDETQNEGSL